MATQNLTGVDALLKNVYRGPWVEQLNEHERTLVAGFFEKPFGWHAFLSAIAKAADQSQDAIGILDETGAQLLEAADSGLKGGLLPIEAIVRGSFASIDKLYEDRRAVTGLATQLYAFDKMTSGLQRGDLIVIAARPSMGKTALAINIAERAALLSGATVAVFSLEMNRASLLRRMLSSQARVAQQRLPAVVVAFQNDEPVPVFQFGSVPREKLGQPETVHHLVHAAPELQPAAFDHADVIGKAFDVAQTV